MFHCLMLGLVIKLWEFSSNLLNHASLKEHETSWDVFHFQEVSLCNDRIVLFDRRTESKGFFSTGRIDTCHEFLIRKQKRWHTISWPPKIGINAKEVSTITIHEHLKNSVSFGNQK